MLEQRQLCIYALVLWLCGKQYSIVPLHCYGLIKSLFSFYVLMPYHEKTATTYAKANIYCYVIMTPTNNKTWADFQGIRQKNYRMDVCVYTQTQIGTCTHTLKHAHIHTHIDICSLAWIYIYLHTLIYLHTYIHTNTITLKCISIYTLINHYTYTQIT